MRASGLTCKTLAEAMAKTEKYTRKFCQKSWRMQREDFSM